MDNILLTPLIFNEELRTYQLTLQELAQDRLRMPVFNEGKEHAAILMATIFDHTKNYVYLYCNALNPELSLIDVYYEALKKQVEKGEIEIKIALQSSSAKVEEGAIALIKNYSKGEVVILTKEQNKTIQNAVNNTGIHFAVADDLMYRLEYDPSNFKASSSFNDPLTAKVLHDAFMEGIKPQQPE